MKLKKIRGTSVEVWRQRNLAGKMCWWISVEGSYNPVSAKQITSLAKWILREVPNEND